MNPTPVPEDAKRARPWCQAKDIGPPSNAQPHDNIGTLPALVEAVDGQPIRVFSYWKPTPSELEILNGGGSIELSVMSWPMVPVSVAVFPSRQLVGWLARQPNQPTNEAEAPNEKVMTRPTGRRVSHPPSCGACHGQGCPEVELISPRPGTSDGRS